MVDRHAGREISHIECGKPTNNDIHSMPSLTAFAFAPSLEWLNVVSTNRRKKLLSVEELMNEHLLVVLTFEWKGQSILSIQLVLVLCDESSASRSRSPTIQGGVRVYTAYKSLAPPQPIWLFS